MHFRLPIGISFLFLVSGGCSEPEAPPGPAIVFESLDAGLEHAPRRTPRNGDEAPPEPAQASPDAAEPTGDSAPLVQTGVRAAEPKAEAAAPANDGSPRLAATTLATTVYVKPDRDARRLGYVRLGGVVRRDAAPVTGRGCRGQWYRVEPKGYVCTDDASIDLEAPLVRASRVRPDLNKPLPYRYGFVRATAPQYLRVPSYADQDKSEFKLGEHLAWYREHHDEIQRVTLGANDVPINERGFAKLGLDPGPGFRLSSQLSTTELLGGRSPLGEIPFWLQGGRQIPNVSGFEVPTYALFAGRVRRKTGLSFVDAFVAESDGVQRRFAVTVDMRLVPATKVKPDTGSPFHGIELGGAVEMPFAFVSRRDARVWHLIKGKDEVAEAGSLPWRSVVPMSGKSRIKKGARYYQITRDPKLWLAAADIGVVLPPSEWPDAAKREEKWIDVSLTHQTLVLYEGRRPTYATLVSTGRDRFGDPKTTMGTPQGTFRLQSKHVAAAMDSEENSSVSGGSKGARQMSLSAEDQATIARLRAAESTGKKLDTADQQRLQNVNRGRHPEYGVTVRRGAGDFELRDVPWIQYFAAGYALHGAYWHDVFGTPRSHGCINLAPIDARIVFGWTEPQVPDGWHGVNVSEDFGTGTTVHVRK